MMENKFTPRAEEALRLAQEAAEDMGHGYVGSEHLLLGLASLEYSPRPVRMTDRRINTSIS